MAAVEHLKFLSEEQVVQVHEQFGSPIYVYCEQSIEEQVRKALSFPVNEGFGLTVRYAMKANPNKHILQIMHRNGVHIDASSEFEVHRALRAGAGLKTKNGRPHQALTI
jgi:diaminopimelate decarboxylase